MSDRVHTEITIRESDYQTLLKDNKFNGREDLFDSEFLIDENDLQTWNNTRLRTFIGYEINYANWAELEEILDKYKIERDVSWYAGDEFEAGQKYVRLINNTLQSYEVCSTNESLIDTLKELQKIKGVKKLREAINKKLIKLEPFSALPLTEINSVRFIKE